MDDPKKKDKSKRFSLTVREKSKGQLSDSSASPSLKLKSIFGKPKKVGRNCGSASLHSVFSPSLFLLLTPCTGERRGAAADVQSVVLS
jgi:hypothetical protein